MNAATPPSRTSRLALATLTAVGIAVLGGALWANTRGATGNVLAGLGGTPRPLPPGALQVDDIAADPFNYKGGITLRAVVARAEGTSPRKFVVVDAREAKICKSTNCAKFYLPVSAETAMPLRLATSPTLRSSAKGLRAGCFMRLTLTLVEVL